MFKMREKEKEFADLFPGENVVFANNNQDMNEHWDVEVNGIKIDVKSMKRINRRDESPLIFSTLLRSKMLEVTLDGPMEMQMHSPLKLKINGS